jgi:hypothetical protein
MLGGGGLAELQPVGELTDVMGSFPKERQHGTAGGVIEGGPGSFRHFINMPEPVYTCQGME